MARYSSKYDEYFDINHTTKEATCKTCLKKITKNCYGMRGHMRSKHRIDIEDRVTSTQLRNFTDHENPMPDKNVKVDMDDDEAVEPSDDITEEDYGNSSKLWQEIKTFKVSN